MKAASRSVFRTCGLCLLALTVFFASRDNAVFTWLALDREQSTQLWRVITAHWVHIDGVHLGWNLLGLGLLAALIEIQRPNLLWLALVFGSVVVALWFVLMGPTRYYVGLSGVLNTLFVLVLWSLWEGTASSVQRGIILLIAGAALVRLVLESVSDVRLTGVDNSAPGAHAAGLCAGVLLLLSPFVRRSIRRTSPRSPEDLGR